MAASVLDGLNLGAFAKSYPKAQRIEFDAQTARARGLWERLGRDDVPGVILGDEVGKGKTYIALALAFATLASRPKARVLVLTHSKRMAGIWADRWREELSEMVGKQWRPRFSRSWAPQVVTTYDGFVETLGATRGQSAILFASYDTLKRFWSHESRRRLLMGVLAHAYQTHRVRLKRDERNQLIKEIIPDGGALPRRLTSVSFSRAASLLKTTFDPETRCWKRGVRPAVEEFLDVEIGHNLDVGPRLDLLVVDEAHKLEGRRRGSVVTCLLRGKFSKGVWVTATPFALTLNELRHRLEQFEHAAKAPSNYRATIGALELDDYRRAVSDRVEFAGFERLQHDLRRQLVRSTWSHHKERRLIDWTGSASEQALLPSLALERVLTNLLEDGTQTHVAAVRETLCSSWAATLKSIEDVALCRFTRDPWVGRLERTLRIAVDQDPKLRTAVEELARLASSGEKVVVFTHRNETSAFLARELLRDARVAHLTARHRRLAKRWRARAPMIQRALDLPSLALARVVAKVIAHSRDATIQASDVAIRAWWKRHQKSLEAQARSAGERSAWHYLERVAGRDRRLPVVVRYDGEVSGGDEAEPDSVGNDQKFNLPCAPLILIASRKGQEGIDLHHYCRRVVLYDLPWNPALVEQRIGRVHRLGGIRKPGQPVEVIYCYQQGSYEESIAARVKKRCEMMHALLGAGTWLEKDREVVGLERYRMSFPPEFHRSRTSGAR